MKPPKKLCLLKTLKRLTEEELTAFKDQLSVIVLKESYERIPLENLTNADHKELTEQIVDYYGVDYGTEITDEALKTIQLEIPEERLVRPPSAEEHFVEQNQGELIQRVSRVPSVLCGLTGVALKDDQYKKIMSEPADVLKMQKLYQLVPSWSEKCKDHLYYVLQETNTSLIAELHEEHFIERHQEELIRRLIGVDDILCSLLWDDLITIEQLWEIRRTEHQQMRKLYELVPNWRKAAKDQMQRILAKTNRRLIARLAGGHFVDRHQEELIERVKEVPLQELRGFMLTVEYETVISCSTEKMQMEALFQLEQKWSRQQKDQLYRILAETNSRVIEELEEEHFVEKHQEELVHRVSRVDSILRWLHNRDFLAKEGSDQQKMEQLYMLVPVWTRKQKDHFYRVLKKTNPLLIAELKEGHFVERYREELINRVTEVKNVVQLLQYVTIPHHLYCDIWEKPTDKQKMEILYKVVPTWNGEWKDHLYQALRRTANEHLIKKLEGRKSSKESFTPPDLFAKRKCHLCEKEEDFPKVRPELVPDACGELTSYRIHLPKAGAFLCSVTELTFEVTEAVAVEYRYASWDQHLSKEEKAKWMVAGPLFDIHTETPEKVTAVHLPHFICLKGKRDLSEFKIAHFVDGEMILEKPSQLTSFHVTLGSPTFSLLGPILQCVYKLFKLIPIHSLVQLYQAYTTRKAPTLHLYLIPDDHSVREAVRHEEEKCHSVLLRRHPHINQPLYYGSNYVVSSSAPLGIYPEELEFSYQDPRELHYCVEICLNSTEAAEIFLQKKDDSRYLKEASLRPDELLLNELPSAPGKRVRAETIKISTTNADHIMDTLDDLNEYDFQRFKYGLNRVDVEGFNRIPQRYLEKATVLDICNLLLNYYTENTAVEVTAEVLKAINVRQKAKDLLSRTGRKGETAEDEIHQGAEEEKALPTEENDTICNPGGSSTEREDETLQAESLKIADETLQAEHLKAEDETLQAEHLKAEDETLQAEHLKVEDETLQAEHLKAEDETLQAEHLKVEDETLQAKHLKVEDKTLQAENLKVECKVDILLLVCRTREHRLEDQELEEKFERMCKEVWLELPPTYLEKRAIYFDIAEHLKKSSQQTSDNLKLPEAKALLSYRTNTFQMKPEYISLSFFQHVKQFFSKSENWRKAENTAKSLLDSCILYIDEKARSKGDYDEAYCVELLRKIKDKLQQGNIKKLNTTLCFEVDLKLHILGEAAHAFQYMHEKFIENDAKVRRKNRKLQYFSIFRDLYLETDVQPVRARYFCNQCLKPALVEFVNSRLGIEIVEHILSSVESLGSFSKYALHKELLEERSFDNYMKYILSYEEFVKGWIWRQILKHYANIKVLKELEKQILSEILKKIKETLKNLKHKETESVSTFVYNFCKEMPELVIPKDSLVKVQFKNSDDPRHFCGSVNNFLPNLQRYILSEFKALDTHSKLAKLPIKPEGEIFRRVFGCGMQCPFCSVPCGAGGGDHEEHFAAVHHPKGLGGYRDTRSEKLRFILCSTDVDSRSKFQNKVTEGELCPYKNYRDFYPDWSIQPDRGIDASNYWKFVFKEFNHDFASIYNAKPADLPEEWGQITKEQALEALKETVQP